MLAIITFSLLLGLPIAIYLYALHVNHYWRRHGVPYAAATPLIGNLRNMIVGRQCAAEHYAQLYALATADGAPVLGMHLFMKPALLVCDPELIQRILIKDFASFSNRHSTSDIHTDLIGTANLFFVKNPTWRAIRTRLTPFFTGSKMRQMFGLMSTIGAELDGTLLSMVSSSQASAKDTDTDNRMIADRNGDDGERSAGGICAEMHEVFARYTTDIIASCAFGVRANSLSNPDSDFRREGRAMFKYTLWRAIEFTSLFFLPEIVPFFGFKTFSSSSSIFLRDSIEFVMIERKQSGQIRHDLIDTLVQLQDEDKDKVYSSTNIVFQGDVLVAQAAAFFTAGFETSSAVLSFGLFEMCRRPDIQDKIRLEIQDMLEANGGQMTYESVVGMEYLGMVISEILRMYPPLPFLDRECTVAPDQKYSLDPKSHFEIPKGMPVVIPVFALHRDSKFFPNPHRFDPERFAPHNRHQIKPYTYLPFGLGPHNCIGDRFGQLQSRLGLINFFRNHRVQPSSRTPQRIKFDTKALLITADGGIFVNVIPAES